MTTKRKKHNKRGSLSKAPGGYGIITNKGYRRIWDMNEKRYKMEHVCIWEKYNGTVPKGFLIHHKDENPLNNKIENLELNDALTHKRLHGGCKEIDGTIFKPCKKCGKLKPIETYYKRKDGISSWCR